MNMETITKKEFVNLLGTKENILVGSTFSKKSELEYTEKALDKIVLSVNEKFRKAENIRSNSIIFSDGSMIDFSQKGEKKYYKKNDFLIHERKYEDTFCYIVYFLK